MITKEKSALHPRNRHAERYDLVALAKQVPELQAFIVPNIHGSDTIDFANPDAVKMLNKALLMAYYDLTYWDIPPGYLVPPIPGRADYIHYMADLLGASNAGVIPEGPSIKCLDIGVGANVVYPIIGAKEYGWSFIGSDIDANALASAQAIVTGNPWLTELVELRLQPNPKDIFYGVLNKDEWIDCCFCNPPFHASRKEANIGTIRKWKNLKLKTKSNPVLNFGGQSGELWCDGGEAGFVNNMIKQSRQFGDSVMWFSTLVSKKTHVPGAYEALRNVKAAAVKNIPMGQGNKVSRIVAWTFLDKAAQEAWREVRWGGNGA